MTYLPRYLAIDAPLNSPGEDTGAVCFTFDAKWVPYILGCLQGLTLEIAWKDNQRRASGEASLLLAEFLSAGLCAVAPIGGEEGDDCMGCCIRVENGKIQTLNCGVWTDVPGGDIKAIVNGTSQPAAGTPQPTPGECMDFAGTVQYGGRWLLPVPVSTGDKITVARAEGATSDYTFTQLLWRCADGNLFLGGICVDGSSITDSLAPMPSAPQQALIGFDGTNYYNFAAAAAFVPVEITIPAGITNANFTFLVNDEVTFGSGNLSFGGNVCKVSPNIERFTHTFDLRVSLGGLSIRTAGAVAPFAAFVPGTGVQVNNPSGSTGQGLLEVGMVTPRTLQNVVVRLVAATTPDIFNVHGIYNVPAINFFTATPIEGFVDGSNPSLDETAHFTVACNAFKVNCDAQASGDTDTIIQIQVSADGTDPF
jgi:hypothetical protein